MAVSTWIFVASTALVTGHVFGMIGGDPCSPNPCGQNTQCYVSSGRPVCSCMPGHWGNPLSYCQRGECQDSNDCPGHRVCRDYQCVDSCAGVCGVNADCQVRSHVPVCTCPSGYTGDPSSRCRLMDPQELCRPSPCGANTNCMVINGTPTCTCLPSYVGSPLQGCRHECDSDYDCPASQSCQNYKCVSACTSGVCAPTANCAVSNHRAVCSCPAGYLGDPYVSCHAECLSHGDCPPGRPSCLNAKCVDPCAGVCGVNANCRVRDGTTAVCSCPRHMTGDPFVSCRPFDKTAASTVRSGVLTMSQGRCSLRPPVPASATDLCVPSPCGTNARCEPGHDRSGKERPVCTCLPGHLGDPLVHCRRGECASDAECRADQNCLNYNCVSSCSNQCGVGAACNARNHVAVCSCPAGHTGDALTRCYPVPAPVARAFYSKK